MAVGFGDSTRYLRRTTGLPSSSTAITMAGWVKVTSVRAGAFQYFFEIANGTSNAGKYLALGYGAGVFQIVSDSGATDFASGPTTNAWYFMALTCSGTGTNLTGYMLPLGGTTFTTRATNGSSFTPSAIFVGNDSWVEWGNWHIGPVYVFDRVLSEAELLILAQTTRPSVPGNPPVIWSSLTNTTDTIDYAGGAAWTVGGTLSTEDGPSVPWGAPVFVLPYAASAGGATVTPASAALALGATSPTVSAGSAVTVSPAAAALALGATNPAAILGAIAITPSAAALALGARGEVLLKACTAGIVRVSSANPRYFANDAGIIPLAGFHTWETLVDQDATDPPGAFDFDAFLAAGVAKGCNFLKLWACESLRDWCDLELYFSPHIYERPGPGTANDGKPKADLTRFNQTYFDRLRARAIEAGNQGMIVCVQLFQGWQVTQKGYAVGAPGTYHPFNGPNNINGIDGDTNNDGELGETRDETWTAVFDLHKAYVNKVIATVGDLDHIIYEISNEEDAAGAVDWQYALIDHIHTVEAGNAKQHPVGMTVLFPSGSDADLFASDAEWISPKDGSNLTTLTASTGAKVILYDTDHTVGLTDDHKWVWGAFCRGLSPLYMDEWDGGFYGTDKRLTTANQRIRANLGYVLDYAARIDLANATPQGSLSSTGFALAKTTGAAQILAYQNVSGAFTVNLTSISGTFTVEWLRTSTGATQAGSNVDGGAVRTLTPPWAGEDVVAFLEKLGETISPTAAALALGAASPAIILGALTITPAAAQLAAVAASPAVILAAVAITPSAAQAGITASDPAIILGAVVVAPSVAVLALGATDPATVLGALTVSPNAAALALSAASPDVQAGGAITVSPTAAPVGMGATDPAVSLGAISLTPASAALALSATDPVIGVGGLDITPDAAPLALGATTPAVSLGPLAISPDAAPLALGAASPALLFGAATLTPSPARVGMGATAPNVVIGVIVAAVTLTARRGFMLTSRRSFTLTYRR